MFRPQIDPQKCTHCQACVTVCPKQVLAFQNKKIEYTQNKCMLCSHCYAVCKFNAIYFEKTVLREIAITTFEHKSECTISDTLTKNNVLNFLRSRRSIRAYKNKAVNKEILNDLIECSVTAPSGSNCQNWQFIVLDNRQKVWNLARDIGNFFIKLNRLARNPLIRFISIFFKGKKLITYYKKHMPSVEKALTEAKHGNDLLFWGAPSLIIMHGPLTGSTPREDAQYASYNIALMAQLFALGTCYIGYATEAINSSTFLKKSLGIPAQNRVFAILTVGYPNVKYHKHTFRKNFEITYK